MAGTANNRLRWRSKGKRRRFLAAFVLLSGCRAADPRAPNVASSIDRIASTPVMLENRSPHQPTVQLTALRHDAESLAAPNDAAFTNSPVGGTHSLPNVADAESESALSPITDAGLADLRFVESTDRDTLEGLIAAALATHPSIAAARQRVAAAQQRIPQASALDDPTLGNTFWPIHSQALQTAGGRIGHQFALTQKIPWPEKLGARVSVAARDIQVARAELARTEVEIIESVRLAYYQLWLADELIRIVEDNVQLVEDLVTVSEARYRTGGSQQDILRAQLEGDRLSEQLITLRRQKEQAQADLGALISQPLQLLPTADEDLQMDQMVPQLETLVTQAEACNPVLEGLAAEVARDRAKESLACLQQYPDFQFGLGYAIVNDNRDVISPVATGHDNINFSIGVTLPVWREKIQAGIREAAHTRTSTVLRRQAERDKLRGALRRQVAAAYAAVEQLELFRDRLIPRTEQTLEITTADYQGKRSDFTDLVGVYRELLALQVEVARTKATLAGTLAQIEGLVGCR